MRQVDKHEIQLASLPSLEDQKKVVSKALIIDRSWKKLQGWKEKFLSRAGKEVLLKSVIQAIHTYLMGVYKLSSTIIQRIYSFMARFWQGKNSDQRRTHQKSWAMLCTPKCLGGMGFCDLEVFNEALLGRQAGSSLGMGKRGYRPGPGNLRGPKFCL